MSETTSSSFVKKFGSFVPGSALVLFGKWISLFSAIHMTNPMWERRASSAALVFGTFFSLCSIYIYAEDDKPTLLGHAKLTIGAFLISTVICYATYLFLKNVHGFDEIGNALWPVVFVVSMVSLCLTLTFLAMSDQKTSHVLFWTFIALVVVVIGGSIFMILQYPELLHRILAFF